MAYWLWHLSERREPELWPVLQGLLTDFVQAAGPTATFLHAVTKAQPPSFLLPLSSCLGHCVVLAGEALLRKEGAVGLDTASVGEGAQPTHHFMMVALSIR